MIKTAKIKKFSANALCALIPSRKCRQKARAAICQKSIEEAKPINSRPGFFLQPHNVGKYSYYNAGLTCLSPDTKIGKYCSIAADVALGPSQHNKEFLTTSPVAVKSGFMNFPMPSFKGFKGNGYSPAPVIVGNDVWIGRCATIMDGIKIGDGAIIGANAVVTKDVPPYAIVGGVPARIIKYRFDKKTIRELLELKWWDLEDSVVATLPLNDVKQAIAMLKEIRGC